MWESNEIMGGATADPLRVGVETAARIEDLAYGGIGVTRLSGWVVLVRGAFPGDVARIRLSRRRKSYFEAELCEVIEPSLDRVPPACSHAAVCGGCPLQCLRREAQTRFKARQAVETLRRLGDVVPDEIVAPWSGPADWYYRNKMEFTFGRRPWVAREVLDSGVKFQSGPSLGLHPRGRYDGVFDVTDCRLQSPLANRILAVIRAGARKRGLRAYDSRRDEGLLRHVIVREAATSPDRLVVLVVRHEADEIESIARELAAAIPEITGVVMSVNLRRSPVATGDYERPLIGRPWWTERVASIDYRIGASSFFQTQTRGAEALVEEILRGSELRSPERVLDLYCGVGAFSLPIARTAARVLGVEAHETAIAEARDNAARNGITNADFICSSVETRDPPAWAGETWDTVVLDPPRSGLHPRALARVAATRAPRIVCVSCNPAALARDAGALVREAGYRAARLRVFDLFPHTPHLESVLVLERSP